MLSKVLVMAISGAFGFFTTRLIIGHFGVADYAQYALLTSLTALIPFADLGMSAVVINSIAESPDPRTDQQVRRTLTSALRVLMTSATVLIVIGVVITLAGWWPAIAGDGLLPGASIVVLGCVVIYAFNLPAGIGQRVLTGLAKNHLQILTGAVVAPLIFVGVFALVATDAPAGNQLSLVSYAAGAVAGMLSLALAARLIRPQLGRALRDVPRLKSAPGTRTMHVAWPMLVQLIALPIAMQTDRLLLSHLGTRSELAEYSLGAQLFGLVIQAFTAAGFALWPIFAKARAGGELRPPFKLAVGFGVASAAVALVLVVFLPWLTELIADGKVTLSSPLVIGYVCFVVVQAVKYPLGMYMTDARGLRFQVLPIIAMVPLNLGLSWLLIAPLGAAGPIIGSAVSVALCQLVPNWWYVRRDLARRRAASRGADGNAPASSTR